MAQHSVEITSVADDQTPLLSQITSDKIEKLRKVDHLIEIEQIKGEDGSRLQTNTKSTNQIFNEMFEDLENLSMKSCTIFRINVGLRESNPDAYTPMMVSIGPYHKTNEQLHPIEKYKLLYLKRFLQRQEGTIADVGNYMTNVLAEMKEEALNCYDNIEDLYNDSSTTGTDQFLRMLLLDGCFVVEFIRELHGILPDGEYTIISGAGCIINLILRDLLLLENQLPFFVLELLHRMTKTVNESPFEELVQKFLTATMPKIPPARKLNNAGDFKHLLHIVHTSCHPLETKSSSRRLTGESSSKSLWCNLLQAIRSKIKSKDKDHTMEHKVMPNAIELSEAGVSFIKVGYICEDNNAEDSTSLFDIRFENGVMKIPCFEVADFTESLLRNLIAYEQQSSDVHFRYFSDFTTFMDDLIESNKDVNLLRQEGIIENYLGEDKEVASFFNKMGKGVTIYPNFYYKEECRKAVQHCQKPWNRMKANLKRNYFSSPWVGASTVAAILLLILTAVQTVLAFTGDVK